jgi:hypothetical protein
MQASTSEQFVISILLEEALIRSLQRVLSPAEMEQMGFSESMIKLSLQERLETFLSIQASVAAAAKDISSFTDLEATIYAEKKHSFYFA